ncbi:leucine-rich repeat protein [Paenibacillus sp. NRS-1781]|uniref:leucine-rich repeat protein n=1 Tax=Paenibacillus sp. NRS-1781 TaxID=3233905 RepID=UPI003D2A1804
MLKVWKNKWIAGFLIALLVSNTLFAAGLGFAAVATDESNVIPTLASADQTTSVVANADPSEPSFKEKLEKGTLNNSGIGKKSVAEVTYEASGETHVTQATYEPSGKVTVIVELQGAPLISSASPKAFGNQLNALRSSERTLTTQHESVKNQIRALSTKDSSSLKTFGLSKITAPKLEVIYDYYMIMNAISLKVDYQQLKEIRQLPGVKNAWVANTYEKVVPEQSIEPLMANSSGMIGSPAAITAGYTGKGTTVAVIDTGLDWKHEAFSTNMPPSLTLKHTRKKVSDILNSTDMSAGKVNVDDIYMDDKVPFAYDYADKDTNVIPSASSDNAHGTHVAGTIAANSDKVKGIAPDAQLMIMKVFDDINGFTNDADIIAALDDSVKMGADVINMSLGSNAGFSTAGEASKDAMYSRIASAGINLVVAAGNSYSSAYQNQSGSNLPYANEPDSSIIAAPSTYEAALSVASMVNSGISDAPYILAGDRKIVFNDTSSAADPKIQALNRTYDYVYAGYGTAEDVQKAGDLKGKIALLSRGGQISFQEKVGAAYAAGAVAAVIYNNEAGKANMDISSYYIPAVSITKEDGEFLVNLDNKKLAVDEKFRTNAPNPDGYKMSEFSSWGVSPDLKLKPEITAPGENIYSTVPGNQYESMSGTSMASPHIAGAEAVVKQYVINKLNIADAVEREKLVHTLLMNTAHPAKDEDQQYYSPRKQGAGLANVHEAVTTGAYLTVKGNERPKAELGYNKTGAYSFTFDIHSISDEALTYALNTAALSEKIVTKDGKSLFAQKSTDYAEKGIQVQYSGATNGKVTVPARGTASVTVKITLSDALKAQFDQATKNGTFIDGFVMLNAEKGVNLSMPFVGFYGDWGQPRIFDGTEYGKEGYSMLGSTVYNLYPGAQYLLGQNQVAIALGQEWGVMPEKFAISPNSLGNSSKILGISTGMLRNAESLKYTITDQAGNMVKEFNYSHVPKSIYYPGSGAISWAEALLGDQPFFDGLDQNNDEVPEGIYTFKITGVVAGTNGQGTDSWTFDFAYDKTGPKLADYSIYKENGKTYLKMSIKDNHYTSGLQLATADGGGALSNLVPIRDADEKLADGQSVNTVTMDISDLHDKLTKYGLPTDKIQVDMFDYAFNTSSSTIVLEAVGTEGLTLDKEALSLTVGTTEDLTANITPVNATYKTVTWASSDPAIATVDTEGAVTGVSAGTARITATTNGKSASSQITVTPIGSQGIVLNRAALKLTVGSNKPLKATTNPEVVSGPITWTSSNESVASVDQNGMVKAKAAGTATITATASGKSATSRITVEGASNSEFTIVSGVLTSYNGSGGHIVIPDHVTEIGEEAFAYHEDILSVKIPDSVKKIGRAAFAYNKELKVVTLSEGLEVIGESSFSDLAKLEQITLPSTVTEIGDNAFARDTALKAMHLPDGLTRIKQGAFRETNNLVSINIPNNVTEIGDHAFYLTTSLKEIKLPGNLNDIGRAAFSSSGIRSVEIPDSVTSIGDEAFWGSRIASVKLGSGLLTIGQRGFAETLISSIVIPDNVTTLAYSAFAENGKLSSVTIGKGLTEMGPQVFDSTESSSLKNIEVSVGNTAFSSQDGVLFNKDKTTLVRYPAGHGRDAYTVPDSVTQIEDYAFHVAAHLSSITLTDGLQSIGQQAFDSSVSLLSLTIPDSVKTIRKAAFTHSDKLEKVKLGDGVEELGAYAFAYNFKLTSIDLGKGVKKIGDYAFQYNSSLVEITFPDQVQSLGSNVLGNSERLSIVNIGKGVTSIGGNPFASSLMIKSVNVAQDNDFYASEDGVLLDKAKTNLILYPAAKPDASYQIPATVKEISNYAFQRAQFLTDIQFPEGLLTIGTSAFSRTSNLKSVKLPDSLTEIGSFAFSDTGMETIVLGSNLTKINDWAFAFSEHLKSVAILDSNTTLGEFAFVGSPNLRTVVLGEGVSSIGWAAFSDTQNLTLYGWQGSAAEEYAGSNSIPFKVYTPLSVHLKANHEASEGTIALSAEATGGIGNKSYSFRAWNESTQQTVTLDTYSAGNAYQWPTPQAGKYIVYADTKDETGVSKTGTRQIEVLASGEVIISAIPATISPTTHNFDLGHPTDVTTEITWNEAHSVTQAVYGVNQGPSRSVTEAVYDRDALIQGHDYTVNGNTLTLKKGFLSGLNLKEGDTVSVELLFDFGDKAVLIIRAIQNPVEVDASISPKTASFDKKASNQADVETTITWNSATSITDIKLEGASIREAAYTVDQDVLTIKKEYLATQPKGNLPLTVQFDKGDDAVFMINISNTSSKDDDDSTDTDTGSSPGNSTGNGTTGSGTASSGAGSSSSGSSTTGTPSTASSVRVLDAKGNVIESFSTKLNTSTGVATITMDSDFLNNAFATSQADGKGMKTVEVTVESTQAKSYELTLPASFVTAADASRAIKIKTGIAVVTLPGNMLGTAGTAGAQNITLELSSGSKNKLDAQAKSDMGTRPVVELNLKANGKLWPWSNNNAAVTVAIPYTPTAAELKNPEHIVIQYVDAAGHATPVTSGKYDVLTGQVSFTTHHFSQYAVAYVEKSFPDLSQYAWAKKQIEVLSSKGIINGTTDTKFSPADKITRAEYLTLLVKTLGLTTSFDSNFADVKQGSYYYEAAGIAKKLGIAGGSGDNKFNPSAPISRQDMMVLTDKALQKVNKLAATSSTTALESFSDRTDIAGYAASSLAVLVQEGLITGSNGKIAPKAPTTRAEAAVFLYRIYNQN